MGDGLDGWGAGTDGLLVMLLGGIPLALTLFVVITIVLCWQRKKTERQFRLRHFLLYGTGGILLGTFVGFLLIGFVTDQVDECALLKAQISRSGRYSAEQVAAAKQRWETLKCLEVLKNHEKVEGAVLASVVIVGLVAPSLGLWGGYRLMPRRRRYSE